MPWCEDCAKYLTPTALRDDGGCPTCGRQVGDIEPHDPEMEADDERAPWHFKLLVASVAVYLGWRLVQMVGWLV
jgi:hypothetical protein